MFQGVKWNSPHCMYDLGSHSPETMHRSHARSRPTNKLKRCRSDDVGSIRVDLHTEDTKFTRIWTAKAPRGSNTMHRIFPAAEASDFLQNPKYISSLATTYKLWGTTELSGKPAPQTRRAPGRSAHDAYLEQPKSSAIRIQDKHP